MFCFTNENPDKETFGSVKILFFTKKNICKAKETTHFFKIFQ